MNWVIQTRNYGIDIWLHAGYTHLVGDDGKFCAYWPFLFLCMASSSHHIRQSYRSSYAANVSFISNIRTKALCSIKPSSTQTHLSLFYRWSCLVERLYIISRGNLDRFKTPKKKTLLWIYILLYAGGAAQFDCTDPSPRSAPRCTHGPASRSHVQVRTIKNWYGSSMNLVECMCMGADVGVNEGVSW